MVFAHSAAWASSNIANLAISGTNLNINTETGAESVYNYQPQ